MERVLTQPSWFFKIFVCKESFSWPRIHIRIVNCVKNILDLHLVEYDKMLLPHSHYCCSLSLNRNERTNFISFVCFRQVWCVSYSFRLNWNERKGRKEEFLHKISIYPNLISLRVEGKGKFYSHSYHFRTTKMLENLLQLLNLERR